jgi:NAD(P)-dependent dehydrogenase (short-subunit alcohol dehydrogenase family)
VMRSIRVNVVSPGPISSSDEAVGHPGGGRQCRPFPCKPEASYITGVDLNVDGGMAQV